MPVICAVLLTVPSVTLPGDDLGIRGFQTPPLGPDILLSQTFRMTTDGLHAVEVSPVAAGPDLSGDVRFELYEIYEVGDNRRESLMRSANVPAHALFNAPSYTFEFEPIAHSMSRQYRLALSSSSDAGVAFWATRGERYTEGRLSVNDRGRWADLRFRAYAPAPSIWRSLMILRETNRMRADLVLVAIAVFWILAGYVIQALRIVSDGTGAAMSPSTGHQHRGDA